MAKNKHWPEKFPPVIVHDLKGTEGFLKRIFSEREYKVTSPYPTLSGSPMTLKRGSRCFEFYDAKMQRGSHKPVQYQSESYGLQKPFLLKSEEFELEAFKGSGEISIMLKGFNFSGKLWELRTTGISSHGYFRYIFPIGDFFKKPLSFLLGKPFATDLSYRAAGYFQLNLNDKRVGVFDYEIAGQSSLIIECYDRIHTNDL